MSKRNQRNSASYQEKRNHLASLPKDKRSKFAMKRAKELEEQRA